MLKLLLNFGWNGTVIWKAFPHEIPGQSDYRQLILKEWGIGNYIEVGGGSLKDHIDFYKTHGLTGINEHDHEGVVNKIKKNVLDSYALSNGFDGSFWGLRADESKGRRVLLRSRGELFKTKIGLWRCSPMAFWTGSDIWQFIDYYKIPYNPLYDNTKFSTRENIRNIGWLSTDGAERGRIVWLKHYYPSVFNMLSKEFPIIRSYT